ncbi:hypothetical protein MMUR_28770 [Mycolicibacterium murale]|uniref:ABC transporter permease n=1 Tax=Mycolicibacterium murale TaxID=182220 RepID=A0A7I9WLX7_9MYCO|nr:ABC transporter permease [Mycolicibacterium murale]MCV7180326.1 ABC transporter permease [Mycolicibacterium murale]GFG58741.1 hypothetical protein MMUR_28770 [Mycolicibacterium murale]
MLGVDLSPFDSDLVRSTVQLSVPLILAATGETVAERTGMLNIGLEGMMLSGAFGAVLGGYLAGDPMIGVLIGALAGAAMAALAALFMITLRADQVVVGVGIGLLAIGLTTFLFRQYIPVGTKVGPLPNIEIPLLSQLPVVGTALFNQNALFYIAVALVVGTTIVLRHTSWGLFIRAAGQAPRALDSAGHGVSATRWFGMLFAGAMAGLGGAYLSVGQLGSFNENMTAGRGYIALAAVVFGGWVVSRVVAACLVFGGVNALQLRLQAIGGTTVGVWVAVWLLTFAAGVAYMINSLRKQRLRDGSTRIRLGITLLVVGLASWLLVAAPQTALPSQIYTALPYICALVVLAGFGRSRAAPKALTVPYDRSSR